jgi:hypothetical protein
MELYIAGYLLAWYPLSTTSCRLRQAGFPLLSGLNYIFIGSFKLCFLLTNFQMQRQVLKANISTKVCVFTNYKLDEFFQKKTTNI